MFDLELLGAYLVLFITVTFSLGGLILGMIKRDLILGSGHLWPPPRRLRGASAFISGFFLFIILGAISFLIITAILNTPNLSTINYLLLGISTVGPLFGIIWRYKQLGVEPPKYPILLTSIGKFLFVFSLAIVAIVIFIYYLTISP